MEELGEYLLPITMIICITIIAVTVLKNKN